ncbi:hypothetical protein Poli38472_013547 [Pythium oligandrum]|uniref:Amino acid transporter transmembrane domain-containing protein n=1 Tax=Pythium oligandrum TaxID=41045 RepID=A0A8K1C8C4_PYTOL|nr:hypothetical protein Poli38472_013547 [Pythium oligandrum]|eukprot:TMW58073.1 hypothetical protein Poli38472_013547 [Pythium oligandrum]
MATREQQPLLPVQAPPSSSPVRGHLLSFEAGFPSIVDEDEVLRTSSACVKTDESSWSKLAVLLTLLMSAIGSGTLSVPYTLLLLSPMEAAVVIVCVGFAMAFTADVILRVHVAMVTKSHDEQIRETYQELALHAGGEKLSRVVSFLAGFAVFGACVGCVRVVKDMAPSLVSMLYLPQDQLFESLAASEQQRLVMNTVWIVFMAVVLPLGFFKKISVLRYSSYLGFVFCLYLVGAVAYRSVVGESPEASSTTSPSLTRIEIHESWFSRLSVAIGIYNFTYMLHLNVIPLFPQMVASTSVKRRDRLASARRQMSVLIYVTVGICAVLYAAFGLCASSIYGSLTQGNILLNLAHDPIMTVPRVMILFTILFSFPLLFHPLRCLVLEMRWCGAQPTLVTQVVVSVLLMVTQIFVATRVPGIQVVFSFVGSSILLVLCYVMPMVFYARLYPWRASRDGRLRMWILVALVAVASVFCTMATIKLIN